MGKKSAPLSANGHPSRYSGDSAGVENDEWVWIENARGKMLHRARVTRDIDPRVVSCEPGWWYPEKKEELYGVWHSNINLLCSMDGPYDPVQGTSTLRTMLCKVYKAGHRIYPRSSWRDGKHVGRIWSYHYSGG